MNNTEFLSNLLFCAHQGELPDSTIREACERFNIPYPPQLFMGNQDTRLSPVFQTSEVNHHGIHCN